MTPLLDRIVCVSAVSKDLKGELDLVHFTGTAPPAGPVTFTVAGGPAQIRPMGAFTGLDVLRHTTVALPSASSIEATLVTFAQPATVEAFDGAGASLGAATMSGAQAVAETLTVAGAGIVRVEITAPADETLLLRFCFTPS